MTIKKFAIHCAALLMFSIFTGCGNKGAVTQEVTEVRIPRGAGGVGFLPLLVMESISSSKSRQSWPASATFVFDGSIWVGPQ